MSEVAVERRDEGLAVSVNAELVRLLESALGDAKAGRLVAGGVVGVLRASTFVAFSSFGRFAGEVIAGAEVMKADVIERMRQKREAAIVRPQMVLRQ